MIDHIAINVGNIEEAVEWYTKSANFETLYQDETWALLSAGNTKLALTLESQHPPHIAIEYKYLPKNNGHDLDDFKKHRDGSAYMYIKDPWDNFIELIYYPEKDTY